MFMCSSVMCGLWAVFCTSSAPCDTRYIPSLVPPCIMSLTYLKALLQKDWGPVSSAEFNHLLCIFSGSDFAVRFVVLNILTPYSCVQFQAPSWKSLILKVCRGSYPPLPSHLPYELQYLIKQMFKTNPKDRPSLHTILTSHRVSKLLRPYLSSQVKHFVHGDSHSSSFSGCPSIRIIYSELRYFPSCSDSMWNLTFDKLLLVQMYCKVHVMSLNYCSVLNLLKAIEKEEQGRRLGHWNREDGKKVADLLGEMSLIKTTTFEGTVVIIKYAAAIQGE